MFSDTELTDSANDSIRSQLTNSFPTAPAVTVCDKNILSGPPAHPTSTMESLGPTCPTHIGPPQPNHLTHVDVTHESEEDCSIPLTTSDAVVVMGVKQGAYAVYGEVTVDPAVCEEATQTTSMLFATQRVSSHASLPGSTSPITTPNKRGEHSVKPSSLAPPTYPASTSK